jgi:hypothetical protein
LGHLSAFYEKNGFVILEENFSQLGEFSFQNSYTGEISSLIITPEISREFKKIRARKKKKFLEFFQKIQSSVLFLSSKEKVFQKLFLFLQKM